MRIHLLQQGVLVAILLATGCTSAAAASDAPVKKSRAGICHEQGTTGFAQTKRFKPFETIQACLKSGGRLPRGAAFRKPTFDPTKPAHAGDDGVLFGPLIRVVDGDTFDAKIQGAVLRFRLAGVDAPESNQPFGDEARKELAELIGEQPCVLVYQEGDIYGRLVAHLWIGETYVNAEMVKHGLAWFDSASAPNDLLVSYENEARDEKRGLWVTPADEPVAPWVWRDERR
jgi:micrococcal nuclease